MKPAIVVIAFNRPSSLRRILSFLSKAIYSGIEVELVISIDFQDSKDHSEVVSVAETFDWKFGTKKVIVHEKNLGLRSHVLSCGDLSEIYGTIIMLEDDLVVSPHFYSYVQEVLAYYEHDSTIGGISLYNHQTNFCNRVPFVLIGEYSSDVYFLQIASSWGQAWTRTQWKEFRSWYDEGQTLSRLDQIPESVVNWRESSWLKYFIKYLVVKNKYFVYPKVSLSTNFGDSGTHNLKSDTTFQVPVAYSFADNFRLQPMNKSVNVYDSFFELSPDVIKRLNPDLEGLDFTMDLYGMKNLSTFSIEYVISIKPVINPSLRSYGLALKPMPANIIDNIEGEFFRLAKKEDFSNNYNSNHYNNELWTYFYSKLDIVKMYPFLLTNFWGQLKRKLKLNRY